MKLSSRNKSKGAQLPQTVHNSSGGTFPAGPTPMQTNYDTSSSGYNSSFDPTSQHSFQPTPIFNSPHSINQPSQPNPQMNFQSPFMTPTTPAADPQMQANNAYNPNGGPNQQFMNPVDLMNNPAVAQFAMQYGHNLADSGRAVLNERVERFLSITKLKHYFAVDTNYVVKKLKILTFPFLHQDWQVTFNQDDPVAPQFDVNVPDLYIPSMAFVTYILLAGVCLGIKNTFTPEDLGILGSSAMAWYMLELFLIYALTFVLNISTSFRSFIDVLSFCGYKFYAMLILLLASMVGGSMAYYIAWAYTSVASVYFLIKTIRLCILSNVSRDSFVQESAGQKRKWYFLLYFATTQPLLTYWLTAHVAVS
ncbi:protein YIF1B-B-like [Symsagittifera roscoffensis]|uniref:protein YIF1B-B-like n=1 Tax=Symsagittifera roscoffensis TaxID=84072 RepID=UPI00307C2313